MAASDSRTLNNKINSIRERALIVTTIESYLLKNCLEKTVLFLFIIEICKFWQQKYLRQKTTWLPKFSIKFSRTGHHRKTYGKTPKN